MQVEDSDSKESGVECPSCNREFESDMGVKVHHSRVHGESIAGVEVECSYCGMSKRVEKGRVEEQDHFFCDRECTGLWKSENLSGPDNPLWEGAVVDCHYCGESKEVPSWQYENHDRFFCDTSCLGDWQSENQTKEDNPFWSRVELDCSQCGTTFTREKAQVNDGGNFCTVSCYGEWRSETMQGEDHPRWAGGDVGYGPGWNERKKEMVRERDNRECQDCGLSEEEHIKQRGRKHHVHHIQKARAFDDPEKRNDPDNLVTLCHSKECHWKWEKMSPLRPMTDASD